MKHVKKSEAEVHDHSQGVRVFEYGSSRAIDGALAEVSGRYPGTGWAVNKLSTMALYVVSGSGTLTINGTTADLLPEDTVIIEPGEPYFYEGHDLRLFIASNPPWTSDQYENVSD